MFDRSSNICGFIEATKRRQLRLDCHQCADIAGMTKINQRKAHHGSPALWRHRADLIEERKSLVVAVEGCEKPRASSLRDNTWSRSDSASSDRPCKWERRPR